jgi:hypothetical protein
LNKFSQNEPSVDEKNIFRSLCLDAGGRRRGRKKFIDRSVTARMILFLGYHKN